jgi:hypothetical protein
MPAGVHAARVGADIGHIGDFRDRQSIHIRAQPDRTLAVAAAQHADHPGDTDAAMHLDPPFLQLARDDFGRAVFLQPQLRMGVNVLTDRGQFSVVAADVVERAHASIPQKFPRYVRQVWASRPPDAAAGGRT